jgi:hypothetical protein
MNIEIIKGEDTPVTQFFSAPSSTESLVDLDDMEYQRDLAIKLIKRLERERDEAREALMKIEDLFIDGDDIYADRERMGSIARNALEGAK